MTSRQLSACFVVLSVAASATAASDPPALSLDQLLAARRPHPAELEAAERLADARRLLAGSAGIVAGGATLSAAAGPRRLGSVHGSETGGDERSTDLALGLDLPLLFAKSEQRALAAAIAAAAAPLAAAARTSAELEVELAYLTAWRDAEEAALRERELALVDDWLAAVKRRVEAGADPPYEAVVAAGERQRVALELDRARARAVASRLALEALCSLPAGELPLVAPSATASTTTPDSPRHGVLRLALDRSAELEVASAELDAAGSTARWSLASELAREGDEEVARLGLAYRIAPRGELGSAAEMREARLASIRRRADLDASALETRVAAAHRLLAGSPPTISDGELAGAFAALALRVAEGKERPTAVLPERRALVDAQLALVESRYARAAAFAEILALTRRFEP